MRFTAGRLAQTMTLSFAALLAVGGQAAAAPTPGAQAVSTVNAATPTDPYCPWTDTSKTADERANLLLDASTLDQQFRWMSEVTAGDPSITTTPTAGGLGQPNGPSVTYAASLPCVNFTADTDGPWGIAYVGGATAFPVPVSQAASWDLSVTREKGIAMANEAWLKQYDTLFAPGIDIVRTPFNGRNAEYLGEDPLLAGTLSAEWVNALKTNPNQPVASVLKHFIGNTQELDRANSSSNMDDRTLHQLYGLPYEITMRNSKPVGVMCAFNQLNGKYSCENPDLLTKYLRNDLKFDGYAVTDNGAQHSTAASLNAGLDQELGLPFYFTPDKLHAALDEGEITEAQIRNAAFHVVRAKFASDIMDHVLPSTGRFDDQRSAAAHAVALDMAKKGSVLLKNEDKTLPLKGSGRTIAVIGATASNTPTNGISAKTVCSSPLFGVLGAPLAVDCPNANAPTDTITARAAQDGSTVVFNDGSDLASAAATAAAADEVVVFGWNTAGEYFDLQNMNLAQGGDALINAVADANPNTVVVLETGSAVLMPWINKVQSVLEAWWPGEAGAEAIAALLFGDVNPSGKLPVSFPKNVTDLPTGAGDNDQYPGVFSDGSTTRPPGTDEIRQVNYSEGLQVGYKWYQEQNIKPLFAFGHGLSYTDFKYSDLSVSTTQDTKSVKTKATFTVKNTGQVAGAEVPQVYLTFPDAADEPGSRLSGFQKIELAAGESRKVSIEIDSATANHPFSIWDTPTDRWKIVTGDYTVAVATSAEDVQLSKQVRVHLLPTPAATYLPSITGDPSLGKVLTAKPGYWNQGKLAFTYQWQRDGKPIKGATGTQYRVTQADQLTKLSVVVTGTSAASGLSGTATSKAVTVKATAPKATKAPTVSGDPSVGKILTAKPGSWDQSGLKFSYQWQRNGQPISGATGAQYRVVSADQAKSLRVVVTATVKPGISGKASSKNILVKTRASIKVVATPTSGNTSTKFKVAIQVVPQVAGVTAQGRVVVKVDRKSYAGTLSGNRVVVSIGAWPKGSRVVSVSYPGSDKVAPATGSTRIRVS